MTSKKNTGLVIFLAVLTFVGYFGIRNITSEAGLDVSGRAIDAFYLCISERHSLNDTESLIVCVENASLIDYSDAFLFLWLSTAHFNSSVHDFQIGEYASSMKSMFAALSYAIDMIASAYAVPIWIGTLILGAYTLLYDRLDDLKRRIFEGLIAGGSISAYLFFSRMLFVRTNVGDIWTGASETTTVETPPGFYFLVAAYLIAWIAMDFRRKRYSNTLFKAIVLVAALLSLLVTPNLDSDPIIYLISPVGAILAAVAYHYWLIAPDRGRRYTLLSYFLVIFGLLTATVKHWGLLTGAIIVGSFGVNDLADIANDYLVFLLGLLLTIADFEKSPSTNSAYNTQVVSVSSRASGEGRTMTAHASRTGVAPVGLVIVLSVILIVIAGVKNALRR